MNGKRKHQVEVSVNEPTAVSLNKDESGQFKVNVEENNVKYMLKERSTKGVNVYIGSPRTGVLWYIL